MTWFDFLLIAIFIGSVASGFAKGFVRIGIGFAAVVLGFVAASWFYGTAGSWFLNIVDSRAVANLLGFVTVFVGVILLGGLISFIIAKALHIVGLGFVDRLGGGAIGAIRGVLIGVILVMGMMAFPKRTPAAVTHSYFAPYLAGSAQTLSRVAPFEIREGVRRAYGELRDIWDDVTHPRKRKLKGEEI